MRLAHLYQPPVLFLVGLGLFTGCASNGPRMRLHFVDVGQGDATLVELPCAAMLIDTGGEQNSNFSSTPQLHDYMERFFARRTDLEGRLALLVLTHAHIDHTRGVKMVLESHPPENIVTNGLEVGSGRHGQIAAHHFVLDQTNPTDRSPKLAQILAREVPPGGLTSPVIDPIHCDAVDPEISVLWGALDPAQDETNGNNHSVVVRITFGRATVLFTGDLETEMIGALIERHTGHDVLRADVYQVGHHGSQNGTTSALVEQMHPQFAVIGVGDGTREGMWTAWAYGHPRAEVIDLLEAKLRATREPRTVLVGRGAKQFEPRRITRGIYATGWDSDVVLETDLEGRWRVLAPANGAPIN